MIFVTALCFIIPALIWGIFLLAFRLRAKEAIGTIIDFHGDEESSQAPIVEFELPDGQKVTFTEPTHVSDSILTIVPDLYNALILRKDVNQIKILYDPNNPQQNWKVHEIIIKS